MTTAAAPVVVVVVNLSRIRRFFVSMCTCEWQRKRGRGSICYREREGEGDAASVTEKEVIFKDREKFFISFVTRSSVLPHKYEVRTFAKHWHLLFLVRPIVLPLERSSHSKLGLLHTGLAVVVGYFASERSKCERSCSSE